jgi:hypothetical protein
MLWLWLAFGVFAVLFGLVLRRLLGFGLVRYDYNELRTIVQYGACHPSLHVEGRHQPAIIYPALAAAVNDPRWADPGGWHSVGRLVDRQTLEQRSIWTRTYAQDLKALARED